MIPIPIKISGQADLTNATRQVNGLYTSVSKLGVAFDESMRAARNDGSKTAKKQHTAWQQTIQKSRYEMVKLTEAMGDYSVASMKVPRMTDSLVDDIQKSRFGLSDMIKKRKQLDELYKRQVAYQNSIGVQYGHSAAGSSQVDAYVPNGVQSLSKVLDERRRKMAFYGQVMDSVSTKTLNWGKNTQWAGRQLMAGITFPMALAAAGTVKYAYDMDKALTQIVKVYGDNGDKMKETDESIRNSATQTAKFLARTYGQSFEDSLEIQSQLASTGVTGPTLQKDTIAVTRAKILGELNIQDAMKATISLQQVYGYENEKLAETFAYMNTMENQTSLTMQDFVVGLPKVSGIMKTLNADVKDTGVLFAAMKTAGIDAKEGGNAIKSIVFKDLAPSAQAAKTFVDMTGKSLEDLKNETGGEVIPMLQAVGEAMDGLAAPDRVKIMAQVFGIHQGSKALGLIDAITAAAKPGSTGQVAEAMRIAKMSDEEHMEIASGELRKIADSDWNKAQRGIQATRIAIAELGEVILGAAGPAMQKFGAWLEGIANAFNNASPVMQKFILGVLAATAIAGPLVMLTGLFANLGSRVLALGGFLLKTAGSGMTLMTEKQNAMRLASDNTTSSINNQNAALQRQLAIMTQSNNTAIRTMNPLGESGTKSGTTGYASGVAMGTPSTLKPTGAIKNGGLNSFGEIELASAKTSRDWSSIASNATIAAGAAGAFGLMATDSSSILNNMSLALMLGSLAGPSIVRGLKKSAPQIKSTMASIFASTQSARSAIAGNLIGAGAWAQSLRGGPANNPGRVTQAASKMGGVLKQTPQVAAMGFKSLGASIAAMAGPIGLVTVAAGGLLYTINKRASEAKAAQDALTKSVSDYAGVLDIALSAEQEFETGGDNKTESYIALADNARAANSDLDRGLKQFKEEMEGMSEEQQKDEIKRYALRKGMQARIAGATAEEAKEIARVAAVSVDKQFAEEMIFEIDVNALVDIKKVTTDQIDSARRTMLGALDSGTEQFSVKASERSGYGSQYSNITGVTGNQNFTRLNDQAREALKASARDAWDAFSTLEGNEAKHAWQKIGRDSYAGMEQFYENLDADQQAMLKSNKGVINGRTFAKFMQNEGGWQEAMKYMEDNGRALSAEQKESIQANYEALQTLILEYANKAGLTAEEAKARFAGVLDINALLGLDNISARGATKMRASLDEIRQAQRDYEMQLTASAIAGKELSGAEKLFMQNEQLMAMGLPRLSYLTDDWTDALKRNADAHKGAAKASSWAPKKAGSTNGQGWDNSGIYTFTDAQVSSKQLTEGMKTAYTGMRDEINEFAISAMDDAHETRMNAIEKEQESISNQIDRDAEAGEKSIQKKMDAADALYDKREQWFDSRWDKTMEGFNAKWDATMERFDKSAEKARAATEKQYDTRIKKIDDAIKAEQDAEAQRQKIFEKEKARIEQYAKLANMAIDINMAISSGNLDEAAKLSNDAQASIETFEAGDAAEDSQSASDKKVEGLEKNRTAMEKRKDSALKALEEKQELERKDLENQRKNAEKSLEIQKNQERKALESQRKATRARLEREREIFNKEIKARRDAGQKAYERKKTDEDKMYKLAKKRLEKEIDLLSVWAPRSEKDLKKHMGNIEKAYGDYGGTLKTKGSEWSDIVGRGLTWHVKKSQNAMANDIAWERMGKRIASRISEGAFGMSIGKFLNWVGDGGSPMTGSKSASKGNKSWTTRSDGSVADNLSPNSGQSRHSGGIIDSSAGRRTGYSGKSQAQSEVWINALKGESVLNRRATSMLGAAGVNALNKGMAPPSQTDEEVGDGPGFGGLAQLLTAGFMKPAIEKAVLEKGAAQQAKDAAAQMAALSGNGTGNGTLGRFEAFWKALAQQESGGNYKAVNSLTGALGKYQVMPANVGPWSREVLGRTVSTSAFLNTPGLQDKIVRGILGGYYKKWGARGAAAAWYAGPGNHDLHMSTRPQPGGPSIKGYVDAIVERMKGYLAAGAGSAAGGGNAWAGMGWRKMWNIVHKRYPNRAFPAANQTTGGTHSSTSYHYKGRALDLGSMGDSVPLMNLFNFLRSNYGSKSAELIYTPAGGRQIKNGRSMNYSDPSIRAAHYNHVHWAMRNGGSVPGYGMGDRTPIMGEPGEFMMKKKAVEHLGLPAMQMLNSDRFINMPKPALTRGQNYASVDSGSNYEYNNVVHIDARGNSNAVDIANEVEKALDRRENRRGPSRKVGGRR